MWNSWDENDTLYHDKYYNILHYINILKSVLHVTCCDLMVNLSNSYDINSNMN